MKVLMFGWEFPPYSSGGLGTACYGLTKALAKTGVEITLVIPYAYEKDIHSFLKIKSANMFKVKKVHSILEPYMNQKSYTERVSRSPFKSLYGESLFEEVEKYSRAAEKIAKEEEFDIIHCHDWMTYKAGIYAKKISNKPLIIHVHATEFDRGGDLGVNKKVYDIEREGMVIADKIISVSNFTKNKIIYHYSIIPYKIVVVHNGIDFDLPLTKIRYFENQKNNRIVLFLGRITLQKGPDYFLYAAKRALKVDPNLTFVMGGTGDMQASIIEKAAELGIADKVLFTGFVSGSDVDRLYQMADVYVMPSVSEPFGITPLESIKNNTPVIISKQSGVSEVLNSCLKVDYWDIDEIANKIVSVLRYPELADSLKHDSIREIQKNTWFNAAISCQKIYNEVSGIV